MVLFWAGVTLRDGAQLPLLGQACYEVAQATTKVYAERAAAARNGGGGSGGQAPS